MIRLTRLSGHEFWLNSDLIQHLESTPDTVVTLIDGHRVVVRESPEDVQVRHIAFRASILSAAAAGPLDDARAATDGMRAWLPGSGRDFPMWDDETGGEQ